LIENPKFSVNLSEPAVADQNKKGAVKKVVLVDENGAIPRGTLPKMSISHSKLLSKQHSNAFNNCTMNSSNEMRNVAPILHAAPEGWLQNLLLYLNLNTEAAQKKFESLPVREALETHAMALRSHKGLLYNYSVDQLFTEFNRNDLFLLDGLNSHFGAGQTTIQVGRPVYDRIAVLSEAMREQFHNKKEFFTVQLMPSTTDQIIYLAGNMLRGGMLGSGFGAIFGLGTTAAVEKVGVPAVKTLAKNAATNVALSIATGVVSGAANRAGVANVSQITAEIVNSENNVVDRISAIVTQAPKAYVEGFTNNPFINNKLVKKEWNMGKFVPEVLQQISKGGAPLSVDDFNKACDNAKKSALTLGSFGAALGFVYGLKTMNNPIVTRNISQL
jgi:hypothetical protein